MPGRVFWIVALVIVCSMSSAVGKNVFAGEKRIIGWLEAVYLPEYNFVLTAKVDTGAKNSSIHAFEIEYIEQKDRPDGSRIRFKTSDLEGRVQTVETDAIRQVRIKRSNTETVARPEIEMEICLAGMRKRIRVNLTDRGGMNYRMILGRSALEGDFIVDVSKKDRVVPSCRDE